MGAIYPDLKGRSVLVSGGASGIGESIVRGFAAQGAKVGFIDINPSASASVVESLRETGRHVHGEVADIRDIAALQKSISAIREVNGPITILISNAAHDDRHAAENVTPEYFDERIAVNLKHQFFAAQAVLPDMKVAGGGSIVCMGSTSWMMGLGGMPVYTAAKSAVLGLARSLARDYGPFNIRVNSVAPGWIMTDRQLQLWMTPENEIVRQERQCIKRRLVPDDISKFIVFLTSEEASACTNQSYVVDGGWI